MGAVDWQVTGPDVDDAEQLASVHVQAWREAYGELLPERFYDDSARHEGRLVGFALRGRAVRHGDHPPAREEQLFALYVLAPWYGRGVAQALLEQCLSGRPAQLWVAKDNARARRFYEKNGFTADGTEQVDHELDGLVEVRMVR
jgi:GNAT superfamily N-acetyltransferase